jgi:hypothetical protein
MFRGKYIITLIVYFFSLLNSGYAELKSGRYFQAIASGEAIVESLWYKTKGTKQKLSVSRIFRSRDYSYDSAPQIIFYGNRVDIEGNPIPEAIAEVPEEESRLLIFFIKLTNEDDQGLNYRTVVLSDSLQQFAFGSYKFLNTTKMSLALNLSGEVFLIEQGKIKIIPIKLTKKSSVPIRILGKQTGDQWESIFSNSWGHRPDMRTLAIIVEAKEGGVDVLRYRQFEPSE